MTGDAGQVSPLAALIQRVIDDEAARGNTLNYSDIARRGTDLTRNNVSRYATRKLDQLIPLEKRRGLAMGLRVHPVVVDRAVADSLDLWLELTVGDWRTDPELTAEDRQQIETYIQAIKESRGRRSAR
jgi:hypothetical protein